VLWRPFAFCVWPNRSPRLPKASPPKARPRAAAANLSTLALLLGNFFYPTPLLYTLAFTIWLGSAWAQSGPTTSSTVRLFFTNLAVISSVAGLSWALHGYQNILAEPSSLAGLPVAVLSWFPILASRVTNALCQPQASWPYLLTVFLLTEIVFPGRLFQVGTTVDRSDSRRNH